MSVGNIVGIIVLSVAFSINLMTQPIFNVIASNQPQTWQEILSDLITDPKELVKALDLNLDSKPVSMAELRKFPLKVPRPFVRAMRKGNWNDPLLRQIWPSKEEDIKKEGFSRDPLKEKGANPIAGLLHKYQGRVLLTTTSLCAVHCRYCFRRHFDYDSNSPNREHWKNAIAYIEKDSSIQEVILSGGDPLASSDRQLSWLIQELESVPHLKTLRIHTRMPIVLPQRLTLNLSNLLRKTRLKAVIVLHCNHAQEITDVVRVGLNIMSEAGIILLNQSVLLAEVNDSTEILAELSLKLFSANVLPYYLHMPDKVIGTVHFSVSQTKALAILKSMQASLPGYLVPQLVQEEPEKPSKTHLI